MSLDSVVFALNQPPKKVFYSADSSLCRVCATVCDRDHSNNLFSERNCGLLVVAETLHGKSLPRGDFPHLVCRSCSRRLNNSKLLQDQIDKSQASFESKVGERFKRCIEISPSALRRQSKVLGFPLLNTSQKLERHFETNTCSTSPSPGWYFIVLSTKCT